MRTQRRSTKLLRLLMALALVAGLAACGDDDDDAATDTGTGTGTEGEGETASGDLDTYCARTVDIETIPDPDLDFESMSEEQLAEEAKRFASEDLKPIADEIVAAAPPEVEDDIAVLAGAVDEIAETGNFEAFESPEVEAASERVHEFDLENCDWQQVDVTASEYAFEGIPEELDAGVTSFEFSNEGEEFHELIVIRKKPETTESFDELLELPEEEAQAKTEVAASTFAEPGDSADYTLGDLTAGEYIALCFIPVGSTPEAGEDVEGPPHFTQGMRAEFTVS